ncbi:MAG: hypothetical protein QM756_23640 [Polyangiaceae bacterium]
MTKSTTNAAQLFLQGLAIGICLASAPANAATDAAAVAATTPPAKRFLEEFGNATSLGKACSYREEAIGQYYAKEFARLIRQEAKGPTADQDVDREVGIALVTAKMYANQRTEGRHFTSEQCAMARKAIDESVPRGYDKP